MKTQKNVILPQILFNYLNKQVIQLVNDPYIIEIMLNPDGKLWAESLKKGNYLTNIIIDEQQARIIIKLIAAHKNIIVNTEYPEVSCELPNDSARFHAWLPPITNKPCFTIRKKIASPLSLYDYVLKKTLTSHQANFLKKTISAKKNILIAGSSSSGKTTFANALLNELKNSSERIIILEDTAELQLSTNNFIKAKTSLSKNMRDLVKGALRMRPDRIIIGEIRDASALELLKSWNTGHSGGFCTIHANSPEMTISRLTSLIHC